jgi:phage tail protein X
MKFGRQVFSRSALIATFALVAGPLTADTGSGRQVTPMSFPVAPCETYKVRAGDTLGLIAARTGGSGIRSADIFEANRGLLGSPDQLEVGVEIKIPCTTGERFVPVLADTDVPELAVAPLWEASSGEGLVQVLIRWGHEAGFDVIVESGGDWRFGVPFSHNGSFRGAVDEVLSGFSTAAAAPYVTFYTNNVMTIGAR